MNVCWIIPKDGEPHRRDVLPSDERQLLDDGYVKYRMVRLDDGRDSRTGYIYSDKSNLTMPEVFGANTQLFGDGGAFRLYSPSGDIILP